MFASEHSPSCEVAIGLETVALTKTLYPGHLNTPVQTPHILANRLLSTWDNSYLSKII